MSDVCRSCGAPVLWTISLRGKRMPLNAQPDYRRGNLFIVAAQNGNGSRLAIHVSHLADEAREYANKAGLRLYSSHFATCSQRANRQQKAAA
jgi:hypothetical protein